MDKINDKVATQEMLAEHMELMKRFSHLPKLNTETIPPQVDSVKRIQAKPINNDNDILSVYKPLLDNRKSLENNVKPVSDISVSENKIVTQLEQQVPSRCKKDPLVDLKSLIAKYKEISETYLNKLDDEVFVGHVNNVGGCEKFSNIVQIKYDDDVSYKTTVMSHIRTFIHNYCVTRLYHLNIKDPAYNDEPHLHSEHLSIIDYIDDLGELPISLQDNPDVPPDPELRSLTLNVISPNDMITNAYYTSISSVHRDVANYLILGHLSTIIGNEVVLSSIICSRTGKFFQYSNRWADKNWNIVISEMLKTYILTVQKSASSITSKTSKRKYGTGEDIMVRNMTKLIRNLGTQSFNTAVIAFTKSLILRETIFVPYHIDNNSLNTLKTFNLFPGFAASRVDIDMANLDGRIQKLLSHIYIVWANQDVELYHYIVSWLAYPIQRLSRTNCVLVLIGEQGCGKSFILEFMRHYVYGHSLATTVDNFDPILSRFNTVLENKMLVCIDETSSSDSKKFSADFNKFKARITSDTIQIESKGVNIYEVPNYVSYVICANNDKPIKAEEGDRRYLVIKCDNRFKGNTSYFDDIVNTCFNQEVGNLFYSYLRSIQLVPILPVPMTAAKQQIIMSSRPRTTNFFEDIFINGETSIPSDIIFFHHDMPHIATSEMFQLYRDWCSHEGANNTYKMTGFSTALHKFPDIHDVGQIRHDGRRPRSIRIGRSYYNSIIINRQGLSITCSLAEYMGVNL